jgi:hypothetical protein
MPKNKVTDLITDQEMAFARLILSGTMTDHQAAEAAGLNPTTAAYTKTKPRVRAYMLEHRALMQQQLAQQEAESLRRFSITREQVLERLWEFANMGADVTRGSITGQVKAISMIIAMEALIPDRRAGSADKTPAPPPNKAHIYESEWMREQREKAAAAQTNPAPGHQDQVPQAEPNPVSAPDSAPGPIFDPGQSAFASETQSSRYTSFVPDTRFPFSIPKNPFARRR